jgi:hypothetical protein
MVGSRRDLPKLGAGRDFTADGFGATGVGLTLDSAVDALVAFFTGTSSRSDPDSSAPEFVLAAARPPRPAYKKVDRLSSVSIYYGVLDSLWA